MRSFILVQGVKNPPSSHITGWGSGTKKVNWMLNLTTVTIKVVLSQALSLRDLRQKMPGIEGLKESTTVRSAVN